MARSGRTAAVIGAFVVGLWLTARGVITRRERPADDLPASALDGESGSNARACARVMPHT